MELSHYKLPCKISMSQLSTSTLLMKSLSFMNMITVSPSSYECMVIIQLLFFRLELTSESVDSSAFYGCVIVKALLVGMHFTRVGVTFDVAEI